MPEDVTLAIVERAHRGSLEQQYAHVLWLTHALHQQTPMMVLLRGAAAGYALPAPDPGPWQLGDHHWGALPDYAAAIARLAGAGGRVLVEQDSLQALGLAGRQLQPAVEPVSRAEIAALAARCARIWYL